MEKPIDIIPHETGWIYVVDGQPSASFPSYRLALKAAEGYSENETNTLRRTVFRTQALNGEMISVSRPAHHAPL